TCADGEEAWSRAGTEDFDGIILDLGLPRLDGLSVVRQLRAAGVTTPILVLTARGTWTERVAGIDAGADDYLPKPFELSILIARLDGLLRRSAWARQAVATESSSAGRTTPADRSQMSGHKSSQSAPSRVGSTAEHSEDHHPENDAFAFAGKSIDFAELELRSLGNTIHLTVMEADLLRYLVQSAGRVVSRKALLEDVWGLHEDTDTRAIDNFVVRLRRYIEEDPARPRHLLTVRGVGYRFVAEPE
ncbi:MAG: response regulator transcription factor, partial [Terriglobales bacterium]